MDDEPRRKLREVIERYGPDITGDPRRCEGLLRDFCPGYPRELNVLTAALKYGAVNVLVGSQSNLPPAILVAQLANRLQENLALAESAARWAAESWAYALGLLAEDELTPAFELAGLGPEPGEDLRATVELTAEEAREGCCKTIEAGGRRGSMTFPPGVRDGQEFRVEGGGGPGKRGGSAGVLIVTARVAEPASRAERSRPMAQGPLEPDWELAASFPSHLLIQYAAVPLRRDRDGLVVAMANPNDIVALDTLRLHSGSAIKPVAASESSIREALARLAARARPPAPPSRPAPPSPSPPPTQPAPVPSYTPRPLGGMPPNYLGQSLLATLCCCQILGLIAVIYAAQVNGRWSAGDVAGAWRASEKAKAWSAAAIVLGVIAFALGIFGEFAGSF